MSVTDDADAPGALSDDEATVRGECQVGRPIESADHHFGAQPDAIGRHLDDPTRPGPLVRVLGADGAAGRRGRHRDAQRVRPCAFEYTAVVDERRQLKNVRPGRQTRELGAARKARGGRNRCAGRAGEFGSRAVHIKCVLDRRKLNSISGRLIPAKALRAVDRFRGARRIHRRRRRRLLAGDDSDATEKHAKPGHVH